MNQYCEISGIKLSKNNINLEINQIQNGFIIKKTKILSVISQSEENTYVAENISTLIKLIEEIYTDQK